MLYKQKTWRRIATRLRGLTQGSVMSVRQFASHSLYSVMKLTVFLDFLQWPIEISV